MGRVRDQNQSSTMSTQTSLKTLTVPASSRVISRAYSSKEDFEQLVDQASPLYKDLLCSEPFYQAVMNDKRFWTQYVGSRVQEARALIAASTSRSNNRQSLSARAKAAQVRLGRI